MDDHGFAPLKKQGDVPFTELSLCGHTGSDRLNPVRFLHILKINKCAAVLALWEFSKARKRRTPPFAKKGFRCETPENLNCLRFAHFWELFFGYYYLLCLHRAHRLAPSYKMFSTGTAPCTGNLFKLYVFTILFELRKLFIIYSEKYLLESIFEKRK